MNQLRAYLLWSVPWSLVVWIYFTHTFFLSSEVLRPFGLAITVSDYLDWCSMPARGDVFHCLQRYVLRPSLWQLQTLDPWLWAGTSRSSSLKNKVLERQHSLGASFTRDTLEKLSGQSCGLWTPSAKHSTLSHLAVHAPEAFASSDRFASNILAWISYQLSALQCKGRLRGFQQHADSDYLQPLQVEHDRLIFLKEYCLRSECSCVKMPSWDFMNVCRRVMFCRSDLVMQSDAPCWTSCGRSNLRISLWAKKLIQSTCLK